MTQLNRQVQSLRSLKITVGLLKTQDWKVRHWRKKRYGKRWTAKWTTTI